MYASYSSLYHFMGNENPSNEYFGSQYCVTSGCILELGVYEANFLIGRTDMSFSYFLDHRLWPTLGLNFIFIIIFAYPLKKYLDTYAEALRND